MSPAKTLKTFGASRRRVRVYVEAGLVRVRWRQSGRRITKSWPDTADNRATAKAYAEGVALGRDLPSRTEPLTLRRLWELYAEAEFPNLRDRTKKLYREYWNRWETAWGKGFVAETTTLEMVLQFRRDLARQGRAISTIRHSIETVKMIYRWAELHELLERNRISLYRFKVAKESVVAAPPEYRKEDFNKILAQLDPKKSTQWRPFVALTICGYQGVRQNSMLHLQWSDVDFTGNRITWRARWSKMGKEWTQPLRPATRAALEIARAWLTKDGYDGPWVLPRASSKSKKDVYSIQSLWLALKAAEGKAGIKHLKQRGAHGFRRMLAGDVAALTGDATLAMMSIGDGDVRLASRYVQRRDDRLLDAFERLDSPEEAAKP